MQIAKVMNIYEFTFSADPIHITYYLNIIYVVNYASLIVTWAVEHLARKTHFTYCVLFCVILFLGCLFIIVITSELLELKLQYEYQVGGSYR